MSRVWGQQFGQFGDGVIFVTKNAWLQQLDGIMSGIDGKEPHTIASMTKCERDRIIINLVKIGISKSALERETGISRGMIIRICIEK